MMSIIIQVIGKMTMNMIFFNNDGKRDPEELAYEEEAEPLFRSKL